MITEFRKAYEKYLSIEPEIPSEITILLDKLDERELENERKQKCIDSSCWLTRNW